ncbi:hypothetical protein SVXNc_0599 [Candidatus Nanohalococcus occultus]|uniref:Uncharacterized protein n=2 Tax=Candidatus Nanohalococcus occultus TaxID=2978047 RepID=A0ABY8CGK3_9ARCH|nr:hypothetical protein SVXNc_0599 [Candidatus Nanohaloarchaeota archaeon SVXNc]
MVMEEQTGPRYVLFRNGSSMKEFEDVKQILDGVSYEEVESDEIFDNAFTKGDPILGVKTAIGYVTHRGYDSIDEAMSVLEGE